MEISKEIIEVSKLQWFPEMMKELGYEPVRHGYWELSPFDGNWTCSKCGNKPYHSNMKNMNYCPNCGAKMTRRQKDGNVSTL